jgi:hypothetical protein
MKFLGRGKVDVKEVIQSVTVTPVDVGTLTTPGQSVETVIKVQTNLGLRDPKTVTGLSATSPLVSLAFIAPNKVRVTLGSATGAVTANFDFEGDAT